MASRRNIHTVNHPDEINLSHPYPQKHSPLNVVTNISLHDIHVQSDYYCLQPLPTPAREIMHHKLLPECVIVNGSALPGEEACSRCRQTDCLAFNSCIF